MSYTEHDYRRLPFLPASRPPRRLPAPHRSRLAAAEARRQTAIARAAVIEVLG